jgi:hypothetical protein
MTSVLQYHHKHNFGKNINPNNIIYNDLVIGDSETGAKPDNKIFNMIENAYIILSFLAQLYKNPDMNKLQKKNKINNKKVQLNNNVLKLNNINFQLNNNVIKNNKVQQNNNVHSQINTNVIEIQKLKTKIQEQIDILNDIISGKINVLSGQNMIQTKLFFESLRKKGQDPEHYGIHLNASPGKNENDIGLSGSILPPHPNTNTMNKRSRKIQIGFNSYAADRNLLRQALYTGNTDKPLSEIVKHFAELYTGKEIDPGQIKAIQKELGEKGIQKLNEQFVNDMKDDDPTISNEIESKPTSMIVVSPYFEDVEKKKEKTPMPKNIPYIPFDDVNIYYRLCKDFMPPQGIKITDYNKYGYSQKNVNNNEKLKMKLQNEIKNHRIMKSLWYNAHLSIPIGKGTPKNKTYLDNDFTTTINTNGKLNMNKVDNNHHRVIHTSMYGFFMIYRNFNEMTMKSTLPKQQNQMMGGKNDDSPKQYLSYNDRGMIARHTPVRRFLELDPMHYINKNKRPYSELKYSLLRHLFEKLNTNTNYEIEEKLIPIVFITNENNEEVSLSKLEEMKNKVKENRSNNKDNKYQNEFIKDVNSIVDAYNFDKNKRNFELLLCRADRELLNSLNIQNVKHVMTEKKMKQENINKIKKLNISKSAKKKKLREKKKKIREREQKKASKTSFNYYKEDTNSWNQKRINYICDYIIHTENINKNTVNKEIADILIQKSVQDKFNINDLINLYTYKITKNEIYLKPAFNKNNFKLKISNSTEKVRTEIGKKIKNVFEEDRNYMYAEYRLGTIRHDRKKDYNKDRKLLTKFSKADFDKTPFIYKKHITQDIDVLIPVQYYIVFTNNNHITIERHKVYSELASSPSLKKNDLINYFSNDNTCTNKLNGIYNYFRRVYEDIHPILGGKYYNNRRKGEISTIFKNCYKDQDQLVSDYLENSAIMGQILNKKELETVRDVLKEKMKNLSIATGGSKKKKHSKKSMKKKTMKKKSMKKKHGKKTMKKKHAMKKKVMKKHW